MAANGNYVKDSEINNWTNGMTDATKQAIIDRIEEQIERLTGDYFYPKGFDIYLGGNGKSRLFLSLKPDILSISSIKISGVTLGASWYTHDKDSVYLDSESSSSDSLLEIETVLFPRGRGNIHVVGSMGWPEKLDIDNVVGTFEAGETITGGTSKATAIIKEVASIYLKIAGRSSTNFSENEQILGGTSAATADVNNVEGAVNGPPEAIKQVVIILCRNSNDPTLYTHYYKGTEKLGDFSYSTDEKVLSGIREADQLLRGFIRRKPMLGVV